MKKILSLILVLNLSSFAFSGGVPGQSNIFGDDSVKLSGASGVITAESNGNTNNNKVKVDMETTANKVDFTFPNATARTRRESNEVFDKVWFFNGSTYTDYTNEAGLSSGSDFNALVDTADYLYLGKVDKFSEIYVHVNVGGSGITLVAEYSKAGGTWGTLTNTDGTTALSASGSITFTPPADWDTGTVNTINTKYWVRLSASAISSTPWLYLVIPQSKNLVEMYANRNDTVPAFVIDKRGFRGFGTATPTTENFFSGTSYFNGSTFLTGAANAVYNITFMTQGTESLSNDGTITKTARTLAQVQGNGGAVTLDTDPAVANGNWGGDMLLIRGMSDSNTVTIADNCNVQLAGNASCVLGAGDFLLLVWNETDWFEVCRNTTN